jgi:hypothetical protein
MEEEGRGHNFVQNFTQEMKGESDDAFLYPVQVSGIHIQVSLRHFVSNVSAGRK